MIETAQRTLAEYENVSGRCDCCGEPGPVLDRELENKRFRLCVICIRDYGVDDATVGSV